MGKSDAKPGQASNRLDAGMTKLKEACIAYAEKHKGVRRTVLAIVVLWVSAAVFAGLWVMLHRPLTGHDVAFLLGVVALMHVPIALYFNTRGKE